MSFVFLGRAAICLALLTVSTAVAQQSTGPETEKRFPPLVLAPELQATLFACDPLIEYPSVISLGPRQGSLFVAQDYMTGLGYNSPRRSEIKLVEDADNDGYRPMTGDTVASSSIECAGAGVVDANGAIGDCDDSDASRNPGASETYGDGLDSDCDGLELCYADLDGDGYRTSDLVQSSDEDCVDAGEAVADAPLVDCDDTLKGVNPGAEEIEGDGIDQDCDGSDGPKGGCSATGAGSTGGFAWFLMVGVMLLQRRTRRA